MNKKIIVSLIFSLIIAFTGTSNFASASVVAPPDDSDFVNRFDEFSVYPGTVNGASIFDNQLLFIGPWNSTVSFC